MAYSDGGAEWLAQLRQYISSNYDKLLDFFNKHLPQIPVVRMEGTYLAWVDCSALNYTSEEIEERLLKEHNVWVNAGCMYGKEGEHFLRINMACPWERLEEGLRRIAAGIEAMAR